MSNLNDDLEMHKIQGGNFGYSAARLTDLGATEYTLVTFVNDVSGSVTSFRTEMEAALKEAVQSCKYSPRADNLMARHVTFNDSVVERHGFKLFSQINPSDYDNSLHPMGGTALNDGVLNAIKSTEDYAKQLVDASFNVNAVIFIFTDGEDNTSYGSAKMVKDALANIQKNESLESIVTVLVGVNVDDSRIQQTLTDYQNATGINQTQFIRLDKADKKALAKLAAFVSKSISAQSQALGTGGPSKALTSGSLTI